MPFIGIAAFQGPWSGIARGADLREAEQTEHSVCVWGRVRRDQDEAHRSTWRTGTGWDCH